MPGTIGSGYVPEAPKFNLTDDWKIYQNRLEQFFIAYNLTDEKRKAAILLTAISNDVYRIPHFDQYLLSKPTERKDIRTVM